LVDACEAPCEAQNALSLLHAKSLLCGGDSKRALAELEALDDARYAGMEITVHGLLQTARRLQGEPVGTAVAPTLDGDPERYLSLAISDADAKASGGDVDGAVRDLDAMEQKAGTAWMQRSIGLARARVLERGGRAGEASRIYYGFWRAAPASRGANEMARHLLRLSKAEGSVSLTQDDYLVQLTEAALKGTKRGAKSAADEYARRYGWRPTSRAAVQGYVTGIRLEAQRSRTRALKELRRAEHNAVDPLLRAHIRHAEGRVLRRLNRDAEAIETYLSVVEEAPRSAVAADSLYQAGRLEVYLGNAHQALEHLALFAVLYPDSPLLAEALWAGLWGSWLSGDAAIGLRLANTLARYHGDEVDLSGLRFEAKALYWRARMLAHLGRNAEALDGLRFVMERFPGTYYAAMAHHRVADMGVDPQAFVPFQGGLGRLPSSDVLADEALPAHPRVRRSLELWRMGLRSEARAELMAQLRFSDPPRGVVELLATLHLLDDDVPSSHWNAGHYGDFDVAPYAGNARLWTLAYPAPRNITAIAQRVGAEVDIDPYLALAIMRHESAFRPSAQSSAGAVGLMQLMPQSARAINKQWYGKRGPAAQALRRPETNIRLGMTMLRMLAVHFRDNLPLMIAAYNAGPGVAARWYRTFKDRDTDTLVELLTYPGTVAYVKQVIGSYYAYRLVYGAGTPPPIPLELPANLGTWGDREIDAVSNRVAE
jgi:tetratricopeptide (TPR) repeat protein